ncbi:MAG TPA: DUF4242 domain-containing protein [Trueperaceae bacterium]|nr:DUF4242 domain-containing protein [Trueperaceae bacterium]
MPRYMVERAFKGGLLIPVNQEGDAVCQGVVERNSDLGVTWIHSYVTEDKTKTFCLYEAPNAEAIRKVAEANGLPVEQISKVSVLDPYFYY